MKSKLFLLVFIYLFSSFTTSSQIITQEQKQELINSLSITVLDSMFTKHYAPNAIESIMEYVVYDSVDFQEAIPAIIENIWKVSPYDQTRFLWALYLCKSSADRAACTSFHRFGGPLYRYAFYKINS